MPNGIIANRHEYNQMMGDLRAEIISAYHVTQEVAKGLEGNEDMDPHVNAQLLEKVKRAGRNLVETIVLIKKLQSNVAALNQVYVALFGAAGPGNPTLQAAGINPTIAIHRMTAKMPVLLAGCNREMARLKNLAEIIQTLPH